MKYGVVKMKAELFAEEKKTPIYITKAKKLNKYNIVFDVKDTYPNYDIVETVYPKNMDAVN